ncbi:MAG: hypothetical protein ABJN14_17015 [Paracoccaceae bacterium]
MKGALLPAAVLPLLTACGDDSPTAAHIEEGYRNLSTKNLTLAVADFGSEDQIPPILLGMIKTTGRIDGERCEKNQSDLGYICTCNFTPINGDNVVLDTISDIKARVWQVDPGWMVHEIEETN